MNLVQLTERTFTVEFDDGENVVDEPYVYVELNKGYSVYIVGDGTEVFRAHGIYASYDRLLAKIRKVLIIEGFLEVG